MGTILTVRGVERRFDKTLALQATDLDVAENDFITILGPSGCGKSTLLRIVAGLDRQTAGEVLLDGQRIEGPGGGQRLQLPLVDLTRIHPVGEVKQVAIGPAARAFLDPVLAGRADAIWDPSRWAWSR